MHKFRLSNPRSGPSLYLCAEAYEAMVKVSQRWEFVWHDLERIVQVRPRWDGFIIGRSQEHHALPYRITGTHNARPYTAPSHGVVDWERPEDRGYDQSGVCIPLPRQDQLPAPRTVRRASGRVAPRPQTREVLVSLGDRDLLFRVPEEQALDTVLRWTAAGWSAED